MSITLIGDPGSTHMGTFDRAIELIKVGKECGLDAVKFQLFPEAKNGNIVLPLELFPGLKRYGDDIGIEVFASVWDVEGVLCLFKSECESIKFAYSERNNMKLIEIAEPFENVYISAPLLHDWPLKCIRMFCVPEYPLTTPIDFTGVFPKLADGFSDHSLGDCNSVQAVYHGATVIEKHFQLNDDVNCPDSKFALKPLELKKFVKNVRGM